MIPFLHRFATKMNMANSSKTFNPNLLKKVNDLRKSKKQKQFQFTYAREWHCYCCPKNTVSSSTVQLKRIKSNLKNRDALFIIFFHRNLRENEQRTHKENVAKFYLQDFVVFKHLFSLNFVHLFIWLINFL